ncbi:MAG: hypothetical protein JNL26_18135 [Gemmatimonadetes bacterium]|nr:hypothetical protein [Gemmatimonadota bacterium]
MPSGDTTALVVVNGATAIGFFPPPLDSAEAEESGYSEGLAHVGFALADARACLSRDSLQTVLIVDTAVRVHNRGQVDTLHFSRVDSLSYGIYLIAPGRTPQLINALGPSALSPAVTEALGAYLRRPACPAADSREPAV